MSKVTVMALHRTALIVLMICLNGNWASGAELQKTLNPLDLRPPCKPVDIIMFADDYSSFHFTLIDATGKNLRVSFGQKGVHFGETDAGAQSVPGSAQEQVLLKIIRDAYAQIHDPSLEKQKGYPYIPGKEKQCFDQRTMEYAIRIFERRCAKKAELEYDELK